METLLGWIESTPLSVWTRESTSVWAFPAILSAHAIGMGIAAGLSMAFALHLLGVGRGIPTSELRRFVGLLWAGFWLNAASGVLLLIAYPTKALTNPVFYLKIGLIGVAMRLLVIITRQMFRADVQQHAWMASRARWLAAASLASWTGAITAGRLLAYTHRHLLAGF
jgi:hypothetical protein